MTNEKPAHETKMIEQGMQVKLPRAPHPDTLNNPQMLILSVCRKQLICYCPQHRCGAVLQIDTDVWIMHNPVSFVEFYNTLAQRGIELPEGEGHDAWLQAIALASPQGDVAH